MGFARSGSRGGVHLDAVTIAIVLGIVLLGLVMVTSASVSIAGEETGQPFYYLTRQLLLTLIGVGCAALLFTVRTDLLERASVPLLARKGRASYLGERSIGHQDPGATSAALILRALERVVAAETS